MTMAISDELLDGTVRHSVYLERYKRSVIRDVLKLLDKTDSDISRSLVRRDIQNMSPRQISALYKVLRRKIDDGYERIFKVLQKEIDELSEYEAKWQLDLFKQNVPVKLDYVMPSEEQLIASVMSRPFSGKILKEWWKDVPKDTFTAVKGAIRQGYVDGQTTGQIIRAIRGTRTSKGIMDKSKRNIEAVVRTSLAHTANTARNVVYRRNKVLIKRVEWVATLDSRTSAICRARDGKTYPVDSGPRPPAHANCRSTTVPVLKSLRELGIKVDEAKIAETRASMNGQVPAEMNYDQWLRKQPVSFQNEVLGIKKGQLFRAGLKMDRFVDRQGNELNLSQLRERESAAWAKSGL